MRNVFVYGKDWACVCVCMCVSLSGICVFLKALWGIFKCFFFCSFSMFKILLPFSLILICAVWVFVSFPESCVQGRVPYTSYEQLLLQTVFIFKPTNVHIYQSFPGLCVIPIHTHIQCQVAALTCLCLNTRLEQVPHQALIHTVSAADWNGPVALPHNVGIVLYYWWLHHAKTTSWNSSCGFSGSSATDLKAPCCRSRQFHKYSINNKIM